MNPFPVLPPISGSSQNRSQQAQQTSIDHLIKDPLFNTNQGLAPNSEIQKPASNDTYLPIDPIYLSPQEEQNLINDVARELGNYSSEKLKKFYSDMTSYDPNGTGFAHHMYISLVAMRNNVNNADLN